jgi:hypothetical protein
MQVDPGVDMNAIQRGVNLRRHHAVATSGVAMVADSA